MKHLLAILCALAALYVAPAVAAAPRWVSADLPMLPSDLDRLAVAPLSPPSAEHPLGTVALICHDEVPDGSPDSETLHHISAYAWDLDAKKVVAKRSLGRTSVEGPAVVAVRADNEIFVVAGQTSESAAMGEVVLFTLDLDLRVRATEVIGHGMLPSLAVSDQWIVAGSFEKRTPIAPAPSADVSPLSLAFHAVVLDRVTHAIVGARVFQGRSLLLPNLQPKWAMHGIAVRDGRAYFSLPGPAEATLVSTQLPSLRPVKTLTLEGFQTYASAPLHVVGRSFVVPTPQGWRVVSPGLEVLSKLDTIGPSMAWNPRSSTLLVEDARGSLPWSVVKLPANVDSDVLLWAWDRPVAVRSGGRANGEPLRILVRR